MIDLHLSDLHLSVSMQFFKKEKIILTEQVDGGEGKKKRVVR